MSDLISRKDVLDAVNDCGICIQRILDIPSAEPERKWIPCSEALPKPWQEVLTTYEYNGKRFVQTAEYVGQTDEKGHPLFCACSDEFASDHYDFIYVAWMPLPEPAKIGDVK